jgi:hypothetical protein
MVIRQNQRSGQKPLRERPLSFEHKARGHDPVFPVAGWQVRRLDLLQSARAALSNKACGVFAKLNIPVSSGFCYENLRRNRFFYG